MSEKKDPCNGCVYWGRVGRYPSCDYILIEKHRRPCPPGAGCTVKTGKREKKMAPRATWDVVKARELWEAGKSDDDIATACGVSKATVQKWRSAHKMKMNGVPAKAGRKKAVEDAKEPEEPVKVEEPVGPGPTAELEAVTEVKAVDNINHPTHYTQGSIECIDAIEAATAGKSGFAAYCVGNIIKYVWRYVFKNGLEDLKKASWYLDRLIERVEG